MRGRVVKLFGAVFPFILSLALGAPAGASAQDQPWATWEEMIAEARRVPQHSETKVCQRKTCTTIIEVNADGRRAIMKRIVGPGVDSKLMCKDDLPCIPW